MAMPMPVKRNETIHYLSQWAASPELMTRFTQVTLFSQRVKFVKQVLCLDQKDELVGMQMRMVCERSNVPFVPKKGPAFREIHPKSLTVEQRFHVSMLLNMQRATDDSGLAVQEDGSGEAKLTAHPMLDRMIVAYQRYLQFMRADPQTAEVPFELAWFVNERLLQGEVEMSDCNNCGSAYINLRVHQTMNCPVCATLRLARVSGAQQSQGNVGRRFGFG